VRAVNQQRVEARCRERASGGGSGGTGTRDDDLRISGHGVEGS
jgi:hypothetical protein